MTPTHDFENSDAVLEYAAQLIEEASFLDVRGIAARRKRDREDADLRFRTIQETRRECARHIRAMKNRRDLDAIEVLRHLSDLPEGHQHTLYLRDAWPLAWKGWVKIECTINCTCISVPPETTYRLTLTEEGREQLKLSHKSDCAVNNGPALPPGPCDCGAED